VVHRLAEEKQGLVFLLWGAYAQRKGEFIDSNRHLVLKSVHPSPLSAYRGFFGNHHFSKTNQYLQSQGLDPIDWR
jgi:uracil-DNA glycosylase